LQGFFFAKPLNELDLATYFLARFVDKKTAQASRRSANRSSKEPMPGKLAG
jgi:hypothetical protein